MQVAGMPAYTDITKAHEVANLARRLQKELRDAINDAAKYNNRERLFDMPITNVGIYFNTPPMWVSPLTALVIAWGRRCQEVLYLFCM